jgi:hypothetical protein
VTDRRAAQRISPGTIHCTHYKPQPNEQFEQGATSNRKQQRCRAARGGAALGPIRATCSMPHHASCIMPRCDLPVGPPRAAGRGPRGDSDPDPVARGTQWKAEAFYFYSGWEATAYKIVGEIAGANPQAIGGDHHPTGEAAQTALEYRPLPGHAKRHWGGTGRKPRTGQ